MFFLYSLYYFFIFFIGITITIAIFLYKQEKFELINLIAYYFSSIMFFISIFVILEILIMDKVLPLPIFIIFEFEMIFILCLFTKVFLIVYRRTEKKMFFFYITIVLLFSHILISGLFLLLIPGSIITGFIALLTITFTKNMNEYRKRLFLIFGGSSYFYVSTLILDDVSFAVMALLSVSLIVSIGYRLITGRLINLYHSMRIYTTNLIENRFNIIKKKKGKRPLFWITKVRITQFGREEKLEKKKIQTWLQDFFKSYKAYRVKIVLNKDIFEFSFVIKTRTKREGIVKGNMILTHLKTIYDGLDGDLKHIPVTIKYLYKKEKWWLIKFPKAPYTQQINLFKRLITLFSEDRNKVKVYVFWRKASPRKTLQTRAKLIALKYKDEAEKETYLRMWRNELYCVKIYLSFKLFETDLELKNQELYALKGKIKSLEIPIRNVKKQAKIKKTTCGVRSDFLRGNLYNGRYLTPISFDFTFNDKMPLYVPAGLKNQIIKWPNHGKERFSFPLGKWIDEYGRIRETFMFVKVDDFVQGGILIGQMGTGKTYLAGHIIQSITKARPDVGVLIINFKREHEENIYSAEKFYKYGDNFNLPYILPVEDGRIMKQIVEVSKSIMGSIGFEEEGVYACKDVLQSYILKNQGPPKSITELLEAVRDYFFDEEHSYDGKFQSRITSALNTRIKTQLSGDVLVNTLNPYAKIGQWYKDWREGKVVQIDLTTCNEWEQRLISILILQTIKTLTPDTGVKGLKYLIVIDEAHRILKRIEASGSGKSDDYIACDQIRKIFEVLFSEFRDRGISFLVANQRADDLHECAIALPSLKFLMRQSSPSVERFTKNPQNIETIVHLPNRDCVFDKGVSGEFFSFSTMNYVPKKVVTSQSLIVKKVLDALYAKK